MYWRRTIIDICLNNQNIFFFMFLNQCNYCLLKVLLNNSLIEVANHINTLVNIFFYHLVSIQLKNKRINISIMLPINNILKISGLYTFKNLSDLHTNIIQFEKIIQSKFVSIRQSILLIFIKIIFYMLYDRSYNWPNYLTIHLSK